MLKVLHNYFNCREKNAEKARAIKWIREKLEERKMYSSFKKNIKKSYWEQKRI